MISLSGCITDYILKDLMGGPKTCPNTEMNKVVNNNRAFKHLSYRMNREYVVKSMPSMPESTEVLRMSNGMFYTVDYYMVGATAICGGKEKFGTIEGVYYVNGVLEGKGSDFFSQHVEPYVVASYRP